MDERIYLDHAATTLLRAEARAAMEPFFSEAFGNPSSLHRDGQRAKHALDAARDVVAGALGADAAEIIFTSGGTEADNAALVGVMLANRGRGDHLITTQIEHEAVLRAAAFLETLGVRITYLPVSDQGQVSVADVESALTDHTVLVSVMHANNEMGAIQPIREIADVVHARGALLHSDAVQTFGQIPVDVHTLGVDLLTLSGHKIYGPKGAGALYVRRGTSIAPLIYGGAQERGRRAGTENVPAIVGFGEAARCLIAERDGQAARLTALREAFVCDLMARIPGVVLNGHPVKRLPNNVNVSFPGMDAESLLLSLDMAGISASSGSACTSGSLEPSHVLLAMGLPEPHVRGAIRFSLGRETTREKLCRTVDMMAEIVERQKQAVP